MRVRPWICISTMAACTTLAATASSFAQSSCCVPHGTPGCDDATCQGIVCAADSFCCSVQWDGICANEAVNMCGDLCLGCGFSGNGDCCTPHDTPFCNNGPCCTTVCSFDPFCCSNSWDGICAEEATANCVVCGAGGKPCPPGTTDEGEFCGGDTNGGCNNPNLSYGAIACGETICGTYWADGSFRDTDWFKFSLGSTSLVTLDVTSSFSIVLGFLDQNCPPFIYVLEAQTSPASVTFCLGAGDYTAFVAPGAFSGLPCGANNQYLASLTCGGECEPLGCGSETAGDCCSAHGTPYCSDADCCNAVCAVDSFCCQVQWDGICASEAFNMCAVCISCGSPQAGDCCSPQSGPFCNEANCCNLVCSFDSFCCDVQWDSICASEAADNCFSCGAGAPECPPGTTDEGEFCGQDTNGGCNNPNLSYGAMECGETICGTYWADGSFRDTDWFKFTVTNDTNLVSLDVTSSFSIVLGFLDQNCPPFIYVLEAQTSPAHVEFCLAAGDYTVFVAPGDFNGLPCQGEVNQYFATLTCGGACEPLGCGSSTAGDCCVAHSTPFCADADCCNAVCAQDSFCCQVQWDGICVSEAISLCGCPGPCTSSTNDCFQASPNGTPGCNDEACCTAVCAVDPFCCQVAWDGLCASEAAGICGGGSNCCFANGGLGCDDPECQALVCGADPFCCDTAWDGICAGEAQAMCAICSVQGPANDECDGATGIFAGVTPFDTNGATTSLPPLDPACEKGFGLAFVNDIWFTYVATGNGTVTVSTCNDASFDTRLAVYASCSDVNVIACNDDGPGCAGFTSSLSFEATCDTKYLIRVGGFGGSGTGNLTITQAGVCAPPCPADLNGDGQVNAVDLGILLGGWGGPGGDVNGDGTTNAIDLGILLGAWGPCL